MLKNVAAIATLLAFTEAVRLTKKQAFDHLDHNEAVDACWEEECAARAPVEPTVEETVEKIEEEVNIIEEEIEEAIEEIVDPEPEPEESEKEESEAEPEEPIIKLPPEAPVPEVFVETVKEEAKIEEIEEVVDELVEDFCGLPWEVELTPEVAEKALVEAIDSVSNYEMADEDQIKMMNKDE